MSNEGKLIVIEGACDGIGKTTQYDILYKELVREGFNVINHHFPTYDTYQGLPVEKYLKGEYGKPDELSPYFINSLYAIDRAITWNTDLKRHYESGDIILLDRYTTSSLIYQSALIKNTEEKKKFIDYIMDFEYNKMKIKEPDVVIFLTAEFDLITNMRNKRELNSGIEPDIHERNIDFMKKVYENANFVAKYLSWEKVICDKNNEMKDINEIKKIIYNIVQRTLK